MPPVCLTDRQLHEVKQAALTVPYDLRPVYLERVAAALCGQEIGDGTVHRVAYAIARAIVWDTGQAAS
jgi:hypothetical protein